MNKTTMHVLAATLLIFPPQTVLAQAPQKPPPLAQPAQSAPAPSQQLLTEGQLNALVSPIALYPDVLLSEILMASTYPLEVVEADRWMEANKTLKGDALKAEVDKQRWDDSVKSLVATPSVLDMMSQKLSWTQQLGDAVLAQQPDIMDAIQQLRITAQANKKLVTNKQQIVTTQQQGSKQVIVIAPAQPDTVYVPYYDPAVVYGPWPYPAYPPYYWPAPGYIAAGVVATGVAFGAGYGLGRWAAGGRYWGGGFNWGGNNINVNRNVNINNINRGGGNTWVHNPVHRQGVRYANADVARKYGANRNIGGAQGRIDYRGRSGQQVLNPGSSNRPNAGGGGNRADTNRGDRPNPGGGEHRANVNRGGNRPNTGGAEHRANVNRAGGQPGNALGNISSRRVANVEANRGQRSLGGGGGPRPGGGGGFRGGGGGGFHGGGGGRRSDVRLKHDVTLLGRLDDGLGYYRFVYNGGHTAYVGVIAQEVQAVMPAAVVRGSDGYLRVFYSKLGLRFQTYEAWLASGARLPTPLAH